MIQVLLRIAVWLVVLGIGYLVFGPGAFDSSKSSSPFETDASLYLPPARPQRLVDYEALRSERPLTAEESAEYAALVKDRQSTFWQREGVTVEEALSGVKTGRGAHLAKLLEERGLSPDEISVFFVVVERDHPSLLADLE